MRRERLVGKVFKKWAAALVFCGILQLAWAAPPFQDVDAILEELTNDFQQLKGWEDTFPLERAYTLVRDMQEKCNRADQLYAQSTAAAGGGPSIPVDDLMQIHAIMKMASVIIDYPDLYDLHDLMLLYYKNTRFNVEQTLSGLFLGSENLKDLHDEYRQKRFSGDVNRYQIFLDRSPALTPLDGLVVQTAGALANSSIRARRFAESLTLQFQNPIVTNFHIKYYLDEAADLQIGIDPTDYFYSPAGDPRKQDWIRRKAAEFLGTRTFELFCGVPDGYCLIPPGQYAVHEGALLVRPSANLEVPAYSTSTDLEGFRVRIREGAYADVDALRAERLLFVDALKPDFELLGLNVGTNNESNALDGSVSGRMFHQFHRNVGLQTQAELAFRTSPDRAGLAELLPDFIDRDQRSLRDFDSTEFQFDIGPVFRFGKLQLAAMQSIRRIDRDAWDQAGTVGQFFFNVGYLFSRGQVGGYVTRANLDEKVVQSVQFDTVLFEETFLKVTDQVGVNFDVEIGENLSVEGAFGLLDSALRDDLPGGVVRFSFPLGQSNRFRATAELGYNESFVAPDDSWRFGFGIRFGEWGKSNRPSSYRADEGPVPVFVPRVRYETLTRVVRSGNRVPVADAGPDQLELVPERQSDGRVGRLVLLDGSNSRDPDGDAVRFERAGGAPGWRLLSDCPQTVELQDASTAAPSLFLGSGERCSIELVVSDSFGLESPPDVVVVSTQRIANPVIERFEANPTEIRRGDADGSLLSWRVSNADSLEISNVDQLPADPLPEGEVRVRPEETTVYTLTACNLLNECASAQVTVTVRPGIPVIEFFRAEPNEIRSGADPSETSRLTWKVTGPPETTIQIDNLSTAVGPVPQPLPVVCELPGCSIEVRPAQTTTYTLTATNDRGEFVTAQVTVTVRPPFPEIVEFSAQPPETRIGVPVAGTACADDQAGSVLTWDTRNAGTQVEITNLGTRPARGSEGVCLTETTSYTLTATNEGGETIGADLTVTVLPPFPQIASFTAQPPETRIGEPVPGVSCGPEEAGTVLRWETRNAGPTVEITNLGTVPAVEAQGRGLCLTETTTFVLTAANALGETVTAQITVVVLPDVPEIVLFEADPPQILPGGKSTLRWSTRGAESVTITNVPGFPTLAPNGTVEVMPTETTTYTLTARNDRGDSVQAQLTVTVRPPAPEITSFTADPSALRLGFNDPSGEVVLSWCTVNAVSVAITNVDQPVDTCGEVTVEVSQNTTFTLTASNGAGDTAQASVDVTVVKLERPEIVSFSASPSSITAGETATLSWVTENTAFVRIFPSSGPATGPLQANGSLDVSPTQTTQYTLRAFDEFGHTGAIRTITVTVTP